MAVIKKIFVLLVVLLMVLAAVATAGFIYWARQPLVAAGAQPLEVSIATGSRRRSARKR